MACRKSLSEESLDGSFSFSVYLVSCSAVFPNRMAVQDVQDVAQEELIAR